MNSKVYMAPDGFVRVIEWIRGKSSKIALIMALVITQFTFLSGASTVFADDTESSFCIDVNSIFGEGNTAISIITRAGANILNTIFNSQGSAFISVVMAVIGTGGDDTGLFCKAEAGLSDLSPATQQGFLGMVDGQVNAMVNNPPGVAIPSHLARQWVPGQDTNTAIYAQPDNGYSFLSDSVGLEPVWEIFRDIAYAGFVIILIAAGFMIMFRQKIGGQVAVGIMNTIPGVVIGLILVTFSFAIVGFAIDISRLFSIIILRFMADKFTTGAPGFEPTTLPNDPFTLGWEAFVASPEVRTVTRPEFLLGNALLGLLFAPGAVIVSLVQIIIILIFAFAALFAAFKVFMTLINAYIKIVLDLIFGPLYILIGSLPGKTVSITNWIKRLLSSSLTFPAVLFMINLARYLGYKSDLDITPPISFMSGAEFTSSWIQIRGIIVIAGYFLAAGAPAMIDEALAVAVSKGVGSAVEGAKKAAGKIPIIGGLLGS